MASQTQPVSDSDRQRIEEELATALLLLYAGHRQQALAGLGVAVAAGDLPPEAVQKVTAFAADRAQKIQDGINTRLIGADDPAAMTQSIADYNQTVLQPFMQSWAAHNGLVDAYTSVPDLVNKSITAAQAHDWVWTRNSNAEPDECEEAMGMSPAPLDDILSVTGSPPPVHERCACSLSPA